jgi:hypothetical protein
MSGARPSRPVAISAPLPDSLENVSRGAGSEANVLPKRPGHRDVPQLAENHDIPEGVDGQEAAIVPSMMPRAQSNSSIG